MADNIHCLCKNLSTAEGKSQQISCNIREQLGKKKYSKSKFLVLLLFT